MPWKSKAQARWGHSEAGKKALGGKAAVHEWDEATKSKLPEKVAKAELPPPPKLGSGVNTTLSNSVKDPTKVGKQGVAAKMPKLKQPKDAFAAPSVFFGKSEGFEGPKHPTLRNLWDFLNKKHRK